MTNTFKKIESLIKTAFNCGASYIVVQDTEMMVIKSNDVTAILNAIDGGDEEIGINCYDADKKCLGWFGVYPFEDADDAIFDYSDNKFCNKVITAIN